MQQLDSVPKCLQAFMQAQARSYPYPSAPLVFRLETKGEMKIIDSDKGSYLIDEMYLASFRSIYAQKKFDFVKLHNWEFQLQFEGKKCQTIHLLSDYVTFYNKVDKADKEKDKHDLKGCTFKVMVCEKNKGLNKATVGYINRFGKKNVVTHSQNVAEEFYSLVGFLGLKQEKQKEEPIIEKVSRKKVNVLSRINKEGLKVLDKLRMFVTREKVMELMVEQELSVECVTKLKRIVMQEQMDIE